MHKLPLRQLDVDLMAHFTYSGNLQVIATTYRLYNDTSADRTIKKVRASVGTSAVGDSIVVDLLKNGDSIFFSTYTGSTDPNVLKTSPNHSPIIAAGENTAIGLPLEDSAVWAQGDYLTVSIKRVGSTFPGEDLTVSVVYE